MAEFASNRRSLRFTNLWADSRPGRAARPFFSFCNNPPVARDYDVIMRPMLYIAPTYEHRLVNCREAVSFLKRIKRSIENPIRMLMET